MTGPNPLDYGWWLASRSAGVVAIARRLDLRDHRPADGQRPAAPPGAASRAELVAIHESTALAGLVAIAVHGLTLLGDAFMHPTLSQIAVPFTLDYRPGFTGLGIIAGWLGDLPRPVASTPAAHRREALAHAAPRDDRSSGRSASVHTLGAGTDADAALAAGDPARHRRRRSCSCSCAASCRRSADARPAPPLAGERLAAARAAVSQRARTASASPRRPHAPDRGRPMSAGVVIAGGGLAAQRCAEALRQGGYDGPVRIVSGETARALRPPAALEGVPRRRARRPRELALRPAGWHAERDVELLLGDRPPAWTPTRRAPAAGVRRGAALRAARDRHRQPRARAPGRRRATPTSTRCARSTTRCACARRCGRARGSPCSAPGSSARRSPRPLAAAAPTSTLVEAAPLPLARALHPELASWLVGPPARGGRRRPARRPRRRARRRPATGSRRCASPTATRVELDVLLVAIGVAAERRLAPGAARRADRAPGDPRRGRRRRRRPLGARGAPGPRRRPRDPRPRPARRRRSRAGGATCTACASRVSAARPAPTRSSSTATRRALVHGRRAARRRPRRRARRRAPARAPASAQAARDRPDTTCQGGRMTLVPTIDEIACAAHGDCVEIAPDRVRPRRRRRRGHRQRPGRARAAAAEACPSVAIVVVDATTRRAGLSVTELISATRP